jgi:polysaccharide biosynthesis protein PslH
LKILFVSHRFPYPPTFGSKVRAFHIIRHLAREHEVTVMSLARSAQEAAEAQGIAPHCSAHRVFRVHNPVQALKVAVTLPTSVTASEAFFHSWRLQRAIADHLEHHACDLVVGHCSAIGRAIGAAANVPRIIDYCDVDSQKWRDYATFKPAPAAWGYRWEGHRLAAAERRIAAQCAAVTVATQGERDALQRLGIRGNTHVFPNGVDGTYFAPANEPYDGELLTFVGRMDYFPNEQCMVEFCAEVLPLVRRQRPHARLQIVGAEPTPRVLALGRLPGVTVSGAVPDVRPYVQRSALTVAPLKIARGTQNKILESMAMGVPVVCSSIAGHGVDAVPGEHLLVADEYTAQADAILRVMGDGALRQRLADAGRARVLSHHNWDTSMRRFDAILMGCVDGARALPLTPAHAG